jgi:hypothetical protein
VTSHVSTTTTERAVARPITDPIGDRWLSRGALSLAVAVIVHNGDHVRRGSESLNVDVFWVGGLGGITLEVGLVVLVCQRHRLAPLAAAVVGGGLAIAYLKVHFLPAHGWLSDSFVSGDATSPLTWIAASLEVVTALAIAGVGVAVLRHRGGLPSAARPNSGAAPITKAVKHPLALLMILSQGVMLVVFFVQRYG